MEYKSRGAAEREDSYLIETEDGFLVRVPESRLESWQGADHAAPLSKAEMQLRDRIVEAIYGPKG